MDVRDLAPSLLSLGATFQEANKVLHGDQASVRVLVRSEFHPGSFGVDLDIAQTWPALILTFFSGNVSSGAANLIEIVGFAKSSVGAAHDSMVGLLKRLRGRKPDRVTLLDQDRVRIEVSGEDIVIRRPVFDVFNDMKVRTAIYEALRPLGADGIDTFEVRDGVRALGKGEVIQRVTRADLPSLAPPTPPDEQPEPDLSAEPRIMLLTIVSINFREGNKWRFWDGQSNLIAEVTDREFLRKIEAREISFAKDDVLRCKVATRQFTGPKGLRSEHEVTEVLSHSHMPRQMALSVE